MKSHGLIQFQLNSGNVFAINGIVGGGLLQLNISLFTVLLDLRSTWVVSRGSQVVFAFEYQEILQDELIKLTFHINILLQIFRILHNY